MIQFGIFFPCSDEGGLAKNQKKLFLIFTKFKGRPKPERKLFSLFLFLRETCFICMTFTK